MATAIYCIARSSEMADRIVTSLRSSGAVLERDISVLFPDKKGTKEFAHEHNTKAPEGAIAGASVGGVTGGVLGLLAGIGALAIPGVGPLIAAGPIMAALSGAAVGAAAGGVAGGLIGMGMPEFEAKRYEESVKGGNILMAAHSETSENTKMIKEIFKSAGAEDITTTSEKSDRAA
jgi:hypothetical protein